MSCNWIYRAPRKKEEVSGFHTPEALSTCENAKYMLKEVKKRTTLNLGDYKRHDVSNLDDIHDKSISLSLTQPEIINPDTSETCDKPQNIRYNPTCQDARALFNEGLLHIFGFHHEEAAKCFLLCLRIAPDCVLAHAMVALCYSPNYNFRGQAYYDSTNYFDLAPPYSQQNSLTDPDGFGPFPSQQMAEYHTRLAVEKTNRLKGTCGEISDVEQMLVTALRIRTCRPGVDPSIADEVIGRPYANEMRKVYEKYPNDPEVAFMFSDSLMVLNAWQLYEFPTGRPLTPDVKEIEKVLQTSLDKHPEHVGLCHLYVHLSEMYCDPGRALAACEPLRNQIPDSGHLIHMATHIDVLVGDYEGVVRWNIAAIEADKRAMEAVSDTAGRSAFYFGYIVHNFHMLVYGAILGGMQAIGMQYSKELNTYLDEEFFVTFPDLALYLESYSALEIHVLVRFGRWREILELEFPTNRDLMLFRTASLLYARAVAYASLGDTFRAKEEADKFDKLRKFSNADQRILHNNYVSSLLEVDAPMIRGEIAYREGKYDEAFDLLENAVKLQDGLNYDEPWGKMQPVRHALGGLLMEQGHFGRAEIVFRSDLKVHPNNPWGLRGLIDCLECKLKLNPDLKGLTENTRLEIELLKISFENQRKSEWADFSISHSCACCGEEINARICCESNR